MIDLKTQIINRYGEDFFYKELKRFYEFHREHNGIIEISNELEMPIKATYNFSPIECYYEHLSLIDKIGEILNDNKNR